jgi:hypothetical protein
MRTRNLKTCGCQLVSVALFLGIVSGATSAWAQQSSGSIAGVVRDTTGGVLPGVTVEAASPALIERVRTAVTSSEGTFRVIDLRPGTYSVTFTLPGFSTFRREGITLSTGFTATVNGEMQVGALDETITVTGASPLVDIQNTRIQTVLTTEQVDALPINRNIIGYSVVTLGARATSSGGYDVGGTTGENSMAMEMHGVNEWQMQKNVDGMNYNTAASQGGGRVAFHDVNQASMSEAVIETGGNAEHETGGVQLNYVPKDGGNQFSVYLQAAYTDENFVSESLTDDLRAAGLRTASSVRRIYDINGGVGGPIVRDRAWFYFSSRRTEAQEFQPNTFWNKRINTVFYEPDLDAGLVYRYFPNTDITARLTFQPAEKHRFTVSDSFQKACICRRANSRTSPEASNSTQSPWGVQLIQATWTYTVSNQLLVQAGGSFLYNPIKSIVMPARDGQPGLDPEKGISIFDGRLGVRYGAQLRGGPLNTYSNNREDHNYNQRASISYISGAHSLKVGVQHLQKIANNDPFLLNDISYTFLNQSPIRLTLWSSPLDIKMRLRSVALFVQDQWTIDRFTLNLGLRYDHFTGKNLAGSLPERTYAPAFSWDEVSDVPNFDDLNTRLGVAYDVFGDGRTAIKASMGRYINSLGVGSFTFAQHPISQVVDRATRTWTDSNLNFFPDCDQKNPEANGECGAYSNRLFGSTVPSTSFFLDDATQGFGNRAYNWQTTISLNHELVDGVAFDATYYRAWNGNFLARDNTLVTPADQDEFCVTIPQDPRLPTSGQVLCGLYDIDPALFGQSRRETTQMSNFGDQTQVYNGVDLAVSARFGQGGFLQGGVSLGQTVTNSCDAIVDAPAPETAYCDVEPPWSAGSQVKFSGSYPLPWWGLQPSFVYQNLPGAAISANLTYRNAEIAPSLGRNLAAGSGGSRRINIVAPQSVFLDRINQLDIRVTKLFEVGAGRIRAMLDVYNLFDTRTILSVNNTFGASWQNANSAMPGRLFKFGGTFEF